MSRRHHQARSPAEATKPAEAPQVEEARSPTPDTEPVIAVQVSASPPSQRQTDAEPLDRNGNVECEALQGVMHLGQFMPPGSKFSLERQLYRRLKKLGCVIGRRQD